MCEVAARQLKELQNRRAQHLGEVQLMESQHVALNFERFLRMSTERFDMDQASGCCNSTER